MDSQFSIVLTTIASPEQPALKEISKGALKREIPLIVVGDEKSPPNFKLDGANYYSLADQVNLPFSLATRLPRNTYSRKNLGYMLAMESGAKTIVETDDDNIPLESFWSARHRIQSAEMTSHSGWVNVYQFFTDQLLWPRGFPLQEIRNKATRLKKSEEHICPIQQGLVNGDPDIDAIHRMIFDPRIEFSSDQMVALGANAYCPFNSQNTTWFEEGFPLMYLPSFCSFRMTDIWRSLIAQRILWTTDWSLLFHSPNMYQDRNQHNLLHDFSQEVPGYLHNAEMVKRLHALKLDSGHDGLDSKLYQCYQELFRMDLVEKEELDLVKLWLQDIERIGTVQ